MERKRLRAEEARHAVDMIARVHNLTKIIREDAMVYSFDKGREMVQFSDALESKVINALYTTGSVDAICVPLPGNSNVKSTLKVLLVPKEGLVIERSESERFLQTCIEGLYLRETGEGNFPISREIVGRDFLIS